MLVTTLPVAFFLLFRNRIEEQFKSAYRRGNFHVVEDRGMNIAEITEHVGTEAQRTA